MLKEVKEDINKWKHISCSWIGKLTIVIMSELSRVIYRFNAISIKIPMTSFLQRLKKKNPKIQTESQGTPNSKNSPEKKNKTGGIIFPDFKTCYSYQNSVVLA